MNNYDLFIIFLHYDFNVIIATYDIKIIVDIFVGIAKLVDTIRQFAPPITAGADDLWGQPSQSDLWQKRSEIVTMSYIKRARRPVDLGHAIFLGRHEKGWTQAQLAQRSGLRQEVISRIERGLIGVNAHTLFRLCAALDLDILVTHRRKSSIDDFRRMFGGKSDAK